MNIEEIILKQSHALLASIGHRRLDEQDDYGEYGSRIEIGSVRIVCKTCQFCFYVVKEKDSLDGINVWELWACQGKTDPHSDIKPCLIRFDKVVSWDSNTFISVEYLEKLKEFYPYKVFKTNSQEYNCKKFKCFL